MSDAEHISDPNSGTEGVKPGCSAPVAGAPEATATAQELGTPNPESRTAGARHRPSSAARVRASRANGLKSTGPRTERGKRRSSQNARKGYSARLRGEIEAKFLGQEPGAAEELYRELVAPYERPGRPVPPMLAMHFHDLARLRLELEAWERIRDAQIEERWRQGQIEERRRLHKLQADLRGTTSQVFEQGLCRLDESAAKVKQQAQCLRMLQKHLERHDYDILPILEKLYGKALNPVSERAQAICMRCEHLLDPEKHPPLDHEQFQSLVGMVALEEDEAVRAYGLYLDEATMPRSERLARLAPGESDRTMSLQGERLRHDIDRKQWVITGLLQLLGACWDASDNAGNQDDRKADTTPSPRGRFFPKTKLRGPFESAKSTENEPRTKLNEAKLSRQREYRERPQGARARGAGVFARLRNSLLAREGLTRARGHDTHAPRESSMKRIFLLLAFAIAFVIPAVPLGGNEYAFVLPGTLQSDGSRVEDRIARIEHGLLPPVVTKGKSTPGMDIHDRMAFYKVPGVSIAVIDHGRVDWTAALGFADVAAQRRVTPSTRFQAASISKSVAATAALHYVEQGRIDLDRNVNDYLKSWKVPDNDFTRDQKVTLRRILSHSAGFTVHGFPGYEAGKPVPTLGQVLNGEKPANTAPIRVDTVPGTKWRYSGGGYTVMQQMLIDVLGEPFPEIMQSTVLSKFGMQESAYSHPLREDWRPFAATAYRADGKPVEGLYHTYPELAAAGLWTTPGDLARFAIGIQEALAGKSGSVISQAMAEQMLTRQKENDGLGVFLDGDGQTLRFSHGGSNEGFRCMFVAYAHTGQGAAIMTNSDRGSELIDEIMFAIAHEYGWAGYGPVERTAIKVDPAVFRNDAGRYQLASGSIQRVTQEGDHLITQATGQDKGLGRDAVACMFLQPPRSGLNLTSIPAQNHTEQEPSSVAAESIRGGALVAFAAHDR